MRVGEECTFCKLYKLHEEDNDFFYDNEYFWVNIDKFPVTPGHVEIIPKRHVISERGLYYEEWVALKYTIPLVEELIERTDWKSVYKRLLKNPLNEKSEEFLEDVLNELFINEKPDAYNMGWNNGRAAGRSIDHFHFHIIPRYEEDMENPIGGVRGCRKGKRNYKK